MEYKYKKVKRVGSGAIVGLIGYRRSACGGIEYVYSRLHPSDTFCMETGKVVALDNGSTTISREYIIDKIKGHYGLNLECVPDLYRVLKYNYKVDIIFDDIFGINSWCYF